MPDDYKVGYKQPPKTAQFQKGKSGNPRGRPKNARNLKTDLAEELAKACLLQAAHSEHVVHEPVEHRRLPANSAGGREIGTID